MTGVDGTGRDTAQERIAALLVDTAHEVETGVAPVDAVVRAGRRRRARRRTVTAVAAVVLAGTTGTLALTSLPGANDSSAPAKPAPAEERHVFLPQISQVAVGTSGGERWAVNVQVWPAPHDRAEAVKQTEAMADWGLTPATSGDPADLVGRTSYFVIRFYGPEGATNDELTHRLVDSDTTSTLPWPKGRKSRSCPSPSPVRTDRTVWSSGRFPPRRSRSPATGRTAPPPWPTAPPTTPPCATRTPSSGPSAASPQRTGSPARPRARPPTSPLR